MFRRKGEEGQEWDGNKNGHRYAVKEIGGIVEMKNLVFHGFIFILKCYKLTNKLKTVKKYIFSFNRNEYLTRALADRTKYN